LFTPFLRLPRCVALPLVTRSVCALHARLGCLRVYVTFVAVRFCVRWFLPFVVVRTFVVRLIRLLYRLFDLRCTVSVTFAFVYPHVRVRWVILPFSFGFRFCVRYTAFNRGCTFAATRLVAVPFTLRCGVLHFISFWFDFALLFVCVCCTARLLHTRCVALYTFVLLFLVTLRLLRLVTFVCAFGLRYHSGRYVRVCVIFTFHVYVCSFDYTAFVYVRLVFVRDVAYRRFVVVWFAFTLRAFRYVYVYRCDVCHTVRLRLFVRFWFYVFRVLHRVRTLPVTRSRLVTPFVYVPLLRSLRLLLFICCCSVYVRYHVLRSWFDLVYVPFTFVVTVWFTFVTLFARRFTLHVCLPRRSFAFDVADVYVVRLVHAFVTLRCSFTVVVMAFTLPFHTHAFVYVGYIYCRLRSVTRCVVSLFGCYGYGYGLHHAFVTVCRCCVSLFRFIPFAFVHVLLLRFGFVCSFTFVWLHVAFVWIARFAFVWRSRFYHWLPFAFLRLVPHRFCRFLHLPRCSRTRYVFPTLGYFSITFCAPLRFRFVARLHCTTVVCVAVRLRLRCDRYTFGYSVAVYVHRVYDFAFAVDLRLVLRRLPFGLYVHGCRSVRVCSSVVVLVAFVVPVILLRYHYVLILLRLRILTLLVVCLRFAFVRHTYVTRISFTLVTFVCCTPAGRLFCYAAFALHVWYLLLFYVLSFRYCTFALRSRDTFAFFVALPLTAILI